MPCNSALSFVKIRSGLSAARTDLMAMKRGSTREEYDEIESAMRDIERAMATIDRIQTRRGGNRDGMQTRGLRRPHRRLEADDRSRRGGAEDREDEERPQGAGLRRPQEAGGGRDGRVPQEHGRRLLEEGPMAMTPVAKARILRDMDDNGPMAMSVIRDRHGPYAFYVVKGALEDGLVSQDPRTLAYMVTDSGRAFVRDVAERMLR